MGQNHHDQNDLMNFINNDIHFWFHSKAFNQIKIIPAALWFILALL